MTLIWNCRLRNTQEAQGVPTFFIIWCLHRQMYGELVMSVQVTETIIYHCMTVSAWVTETFIYCRLCWRFVVMTVPFTQEIKFKHLRNNSQLDKYHSIDIVRDQSAEFNYSNLKTWPRDVIDCHCWSTRVSKLQQPCLCFIPSSYIIQN